MSKGLRRAQAARLLRVPPARITAWVEDGAPVLRRGRRGQGGLYDPEALRAWRKARAERTAGVFSLEEERAKLARQQRLRLEMENRWRAAQLIERDEVVREGQTAIYATKTKLLQVPRQCVLRGLPREAEVVIRQCIVEALRELGRWKSIEDAERVLEDAKREVIHG